MLGDEDDGFVDLCWLFLVAAKFESKFLPEPYLLFEPIVDALDPSFMRSSFASELCSCPASSS